MGYAVAAPVQQLVSLMVGCPGQSAVIKWTEQFCSAGGAAEVCSLAGCIKPCNKLAATKQANSTRQSNTNLAECNASGRESPVADSLLEGSHKRCFGGCIACDGIVVTALEGHLLAQAQPKRSRRVRTDSKTVSCGISCHATPL